MKKFLSLVLALVMTMSLVTISAGAEDFTDDSSITYKEAVDVMSAVGIIDGYTDGSFKPDTQLTRGAAAKIICNLILGPTTASALGASTAPYSDVPTTNTFAGYIAYCQNEGIISGYADGTFRPTAPLTGYAFMKMLLGALGYDAAKEGYTGANWSINVAKQAINIGLNSGNDDFVGTEYVNREEAMLYSFNMIQADLVEYPNETVITTGDVTVTTQGTFSSVKWSSSSADRVNNIKNDEFVQFGERYFNKLVKTEGSDDFGRPATTWTWKGVKVGSYADAANATYTADTTLGTIYADLGMSQKDAAVEVYVDGVQADELAEVSRNNDLKLSKVVFDKTKAKTDPLRFCQVGNGTLTEAFLDTNTNNVTIVCINTYVAEVNKVVAASGNKEAYITLTELTTDKVGAGSGTASGLKFNDEYETTEFASDDIVLFTYAADEIQSVKAAESTTGDLSSREVTKSVTLGETPYKFSNKYSVDTGEGNLNVGSSYEVYLDEYGYAIYVVETEYNIQDYAFLRGLQSSTTPFESDKAALWTYDGRGVTADLSKDYLTKESAFASYGASKPVGATNALIVLARENSNGKTNLKALDTENYTDATGFTMTNGVARITMGGDTYFADDKTQVIVEKVDGSSTTRTAYSGVKNMPTIALIDGHSPSIDVSLYCRTGDVVTIMYVAVNTADYTVTAGNNDVIFFSPESASKYVYDAANDYYTFNAVVNGEIVTGVKVEADEANAILAYSKNATYVADKDVVSPLHDAFDLAFTNVTYEDGVITDLDDITDGSGIDGSFVATGINKLSNGNIQLGHISGNNYGAYGTYVVSSDVKVFFIDDNGEITAGTMSGVRRSNKDIATVVLKDGQVSYLFIQQYWDDEIQGNVPVTPSPLTVALNGALANGAAISLNLTGGDANAKYEVKIAQVNASTGVSFEIYDSTITRTSAATQTITAAPATTGFMYIVYVDGVIALTTGVC